MYTPHEAIWQKPWSLLVAVAHRTADWASVLPIRVPNGSQSRAALRAVMLVCRGRLYRHGDCAYVGDRSHRSHQTDAPKR